MKKSSLWFSSGHVGTLSENFDQTPEKSRSIQIVKKLILIKNFLWTGEVPPRQPCRNFFEYC